MDFKALFIWYLVFFLLGIIGLPITNKLFPKWKDRGYGLAKFIGLFIVAMPVWLLSSLKITQYTQFAAWVWFILVGIIAIALFIKAKITFNKYMVFQEVMFFFLTLIWTYIRSANSQIEGTEKFMNLGFMNSINRSTYFPPNDPWFAGGTINYYYLGHYLFAFIAKLTSIKMSYVYNLALVTIIAHAFISLNSIFFALLKGKRLKLALVIALMGSTWICFGGNLHYVFTWLKSVVTGEEFKYWFPDGTRIISNTINEFPAYSIVLGDVHGHYLGFPFLIICLALLIRSSELIINSKQRLGFNLLISPLLVALYGINSWDFITVNLLFFLLHLYQLSSLRKHFKYKLKWLLLNELTLILPGVIFFIPYFANFKPPVAGITINNTLVSQTTIIDKIAGFFNNLPVGFVPINVKSEPGPWLLMWGFFLLISLIFAVCYRRGIIKSGSAGKIVVFFILSSLLLIFAVEFLYLKDIFDKANPPYFRTNTVFKIYYQAWTIWGVASTIAGHLIIESALDRLQKKLVLKFKLVSIVIIVALLSFWVGSVSYIFRAIKDFYPQAVIDSQSFTYSSNFFLRQYEIFQKNWTAYAEIINSGRLNFDGNNYIDKYHQYDYLAIQWLNKYITGQHVITEAVGEAYTYFARVSANTGLTTIVGWPTHEWQWRGSADEPYKRKSEVERIYTTTDFNELKTILNKYHVEFIYVGEKEREAYAQLSEKLFSEHFAKIYEAYETRIYQVNL